MKLQVTVAILASLLISGWGKEDPPTPDVSATCFFNYHGKITGGRDASPMVKGIYGAMFPDDETKRMRFMNQTETIMNGTQIRHDYYLDRMDFGIEYYMNWTAGMPKHCWQKSDPYVLNIFDLLDEYEFNGTHSINGTMVNTWVLHISEGEMLILSVKDDDNTIPVMFEQVVKQRQGMVRTSFMIENFTSNPDRKIFDVPKVCQQRESVSKSKMEDTSKTRMWRRSRLPFVQF